MRTYSEIKNEVYNSKELSNEFFAELYYKNQDFFNGPLPSDTEEIIGFYSMLAEIAIAVDTIESNDSSLKLINRALDIFMYIRKNLNPAFEKDHSFYLLHMYKGLNYFNKKKYCRARKYLKISVKSSTSHNNVHEMIALCQNKMTDRFLKLLDLILIIAMLAVLAINHVLRVSFSVPFFVTILIFVFLMLSVWIGKQNNKRLKSLIEKDKGQT